MIVAIDDDDATLSLVEATLVDDGWNVTTFRDAASALAWLERTEPELILSDVRMPGMGGFELKAALNARFPGRTTAFVFLSSLDDPTNVVRGLDLGGDDYLGKPVHPDVLKAKVRTVLRRRAGPPPAAFVGRLVHFPFPKILQFCELKRISGSVRFEDGDFSASLRFRCGEPVLEGSALDDELLDKLTSLSRGTFAIHVAPVDFKEISYAAEPEPEPVTGLLSTLQIGSGLFQIQTEVAPAASPRAGAPADPRAEAHLVTLVSVEGRTVWKKATPIEAAAPRDRVIEMVKEQHAAAERDLGERVADLTRRKQSERTARERFNQLYDEGLARSTRKDFAGALAAWEEASEIDPGNRALAVNLQVVRRKLGLSSRA